MSTATQEVTAAPPDRAPAAGQAPPTPAEPMTRLRDAGERLLAALVDRLAALACEKVDRLADSLEQVAADGGPGLGAALGAGRALARGDNPVWGAVKGGFAALGTAAKVLIGVVVALAPVLLLVALVVAIVAALVWAVVAAVRAAAA
ncbi:hypothetical protein [Pseudonocardia sp. ICBG1293]|uniref:hypothetical protein n=1 Tax=Pseudonocardia sp. ICBG1293 TaxID=2844382 RepID=UPI001CC8EEC7|nr:hypothetical protein [Pseudonocardia sp. ICBG1293]